jgi:hypothetical protein
MLERHSPEIRRSVSATVKLILSDSIRQAAWTLHKFRPDTEKITTRLDHVQAKGGKFR